MTPLVKFNSDHRVEGDSEQEKGVGAEHFFRVDKLVEVFGRKEA